MSEFRELHRLRFHLTEEVAVRVGADAVMVALALFSSVILRIFWQVGIEERGALDRATLISYLSAYFISVFVVVVISLVVFALHGFYSYGRSYRSRYKALIVVRAVTLSYLLFSTVVFLSQNTITLPRSVLVVAWLLTLVFLVGARVYADLWAHIVRLEHRLAQTRPADHTVRKVLVIGGAGYIGSALLAQLLAAGYQLRVLDLLLFGEDPIADVLQHPKLELVRADFRQVDKVVAAMHDVDAVIHLGAIVGDPACALNEELTIDINLMATRMIAEVAKGSNVRRFIFASTCSVYGASDEILDEQSDLNPVSLYARSKIASERVLLQLADEMFSPTILRFGTIYGLSGRTRFDLVINLLTARAIREGQIPIFGGDQWRPFVHVNDAALAILRALQAPLALVKSEIFNVGSDEQNYTIQQVGEIIHSLVPQAELRCNTSDGDRRNYRVSFGKIQNVLDFTPRWTVEQGVRQVIEAMETGKITDYRDVMYSNVEFLKQVDLQQMIRQQDNHKTLELVLTQG